MAGDWEGGWEETRGGSDGEGGWSMGGGGGGREPSPRGFLPFIYDLENFQVGGEKKEAGSGGGVGTGGAGGAGVEGGEEGIRKQRMLLKMQMKKAKKREWGGKKRVGSKKVGGRSYASEDRFSNSISPVELGSCPSHSPSRTQKREDREREERGGRKRMMSADLGAFPLPFLSQKRKGGREGGGGGEGGGEGGREGGEGGEGGGVVGLMKRCGFEDVEECSRSFYSHSGLLIIRNNT